MSIDKVSKEEIEEFLIVLKEIGLPVREFCKRAADAEYISTDVEVNQMKEAYRKRFSRKSMSCFEFKIMQDILFKQPEFKKSNSVFVTRKTNVFKDKDFERSLLSSFETL